MSILGLVYLVCYTDCRGKQPPKMTFSMENELRRHPAVPENDARQFANAAPFSVKPMLRNRKVPKNDVAITPLKLTAMFRSIERKSAWRIALKEGKL